MKTIKGFILALAATAAVIFTFTSRSGSETGNNDVLTSNIEALSSGEFDPLVECFNWCKNDINYNCILNTNYGFQITCHFMYPRVPF